MEEFHLIYQVKSTQAWMVEWTNLLNLSDNRVISSMIGAVMGEDLGLSQVVLSEKYLDFSDVFNKAQADVVSQHS